MLLNSVLLLLLLIWFCFLKTSLFWLSSGWLRSLVESFEKHQIYCNCAAETRNSFHLRGISAGLLIVISISWGKFLLDWPLQIDRCCSRTSIPLTRGVSVDDVTVVPPMCLSSVFASRAKQGVAGCRCASARENSSQWLVWTYKSFRVMDFRRIFASIIWVFALLCVNEANVEV